MDAAAGLGMSLNRWWRIENGYTEPTPDEKQSIAAYFGKKVRDVFTTVAA
jgi:DNA-binding XRE family transcriptional regulator